MDNVEQTKVVAFFDVDNTLIQDKSLPSFLEYFARHSTETPAIHYPSAYAHLQSLREKGVSREILNLEYYRLFQGARWQHLCEMGQRWYEVDATGKDYVYPVLERLREHQVKGHLIALVSGSFMPCLAPIAAALKVDTLLCTEPEVKGGLMTGELTKQVKGVAKASASKTLLENIQGQPEACFAYSADPSDTAMLEQVGHPVVVESSNSLADTARARGWEILSPLSQSHHP